MAKLFFTLLLAVTTVCTQAQNVGIGTTDPKASAALEITSSNKGLLIPRTSTAGRTAIAAPAKGLMVYDTTHSAFYYYDGGTWRPFYEKNYDSASTDYYNVNGPSVSLPSGIGATTLTGNSGFLYDDGGPAGNYSPNNFSSKIIQFDDSTLQVKITVEEMNTETFYDSLFIVQLKGTTYTDTIGTFTGTQTGTVYATTDVRIHFKTNAINQLAGFKIRWGRLRNSGALQTPAPLYGWHFNNAKLAAMGGLQQNNNWRPDSVGYGSLSYGIGNKAKGKHSFAVGYNTTATGNYSNAMGYNTVANGIHSTAMGDQTEANGRTSTALGYNTHANGYTSLVAGMYNDSILPAQTSVTPSTPLFIIGNGNARNDRSNAMVVLKNGNVVVDGRIGIEQASPNVKLHIEGGSDAGLTSGGYLQIGSTAATNLIFDNNEIIARDNNSASILYLQNSGGKTIVGEDFEINGIITGAVKLGQYTTTVNAVGNFTVTVGNKSFIKIISNANCNVGGCPVPTLSNGEGIGQILIILIDGTGVVRFFDNLTYNLNLNQDRTLNSGSTLTLIWTGNSWNEVAFSDN